MDSFVGTSRDRPLTGVLLVTFDEQLWIGKHIRRLVTLGAPQDVIDRWNLWLDASTGLPKSSIVREWLAAQLDDPEASMPEAMVFN